MNIEELIAEGERLSRPCIVLTAGGDGGVGGYWGGEREDRANTVPSDATALRSIRHVITVNAGLLPEVGVPARSPSLALFEVNLTDGGVRHDVLCPTGLEFANIRCSGIPLYWRRARSFPPLEALCLYGGEVVASWLAGLGLERFEYSGAVTHPEGRAYTDEYMSRAPFYTSNADAILGGWHPTWPVDEFYVPREMRLAVLTLRDAEPWYEVWHALGSGNWSVRSHIT